MFFFKACGDATPQFLRHADEIEGDDDLLFAGLVLKDERFREKILPLAFGGLVASGVAGHPDEFLRSDDNGSESRFPRGRDMRSNGDGLGLVLSTDEEEARKEGKGKEPGEAFHEDAGCAR